MSDWNLDPVLLAALLALLGGYLVAIGPLRERFGLGEAVSRRKIILFISGWLVLALSVVSPLDTIGRRYLFTASALQLLLITSLAAPLLLAGLPEWLVRDSSHGRATQDDARILVCVRRHRDLQRRDIDLAGRAALRGVAAKQWAAQPATPYAACRGYHQLVAAADPARSPFALCQPVPDLLHRGGERAA